MSSLLLAALIAVSIPQVSSSVMDPRLLSKGALMLQDAYLDQPYCTIWSNGTVSERWVCAITRNNNTEGNIGEHIEALYSDAGGLTWSPGIRLEPEGSPTNAYSTIIQALSGRIYVIYNQNLVNVHTLPSGTPIGRDDELGNFTMRWSDDGGESWSADRVVLPYRQTVLDRNNSWCGAVDIMWCVDQAKLATDGSGRVYWAFTKIGTYPQAPPEELWILSSPNILTAANPQDVTFDMYPNGDEGISLPAGMKPSVNLEEGHVMPLVGGGQFMVGRTSAGYLAASNTADSTGASGWATAYNATFWSALPAASGLPLKNPQGPITLKRMNNGRYLLLWYFISTHGYSTRDPYWLSSGVEEDGQVKFSQPEIALYDYVNTQNRPGYPDFVQTSDGSIYITETNKTHARVHRIQESLLQALWTQGSVNTVASGNLSLSFDGGSQGQSFATPPLPDPSNPAFVGDGITLGLWLTDQDLAQPGQVLVDVGHVVLNVSSGGGLQVTVVDTLGHGANLTSDSACTARLRSNSSGGHYASFTLDAAAHVLMMSVDGAVCDGSSERISGWAWLPAGMACMAGQGSDGSFVLGQPQPGTDGASYGGTILGGQWYSRALLNSEIVGNWRAGTAAFQA